MNYNKRISAFVKLGQFFKHLINSKNPYADAENMQLLAIEFKNKIEIAYTFNAWFTAENILQAIAAIANELEEENLINFLSDYTALSATNNPPKTIAVIMAGNIPLVGFHDLFCVLISGNKLLCKPSSDDDLLMPMILEVLKKLEPEFESLLELTDKQLKNFDAIIATGSNNSARYFEFYFGKYPHIIRKNRNSVAVLNGSETADDFKELGKDVFQYFGLGCRSVSKLFVPKGYDFTPFFESIFHFQDIINHNKYANNYNYNKTIYLMKYDDTLLDNNFLLLKKDEAYASPIGVLYYEQYDSIANLNKRLEKDNDQIQCIVSKELSIKNALPYGQAQCPTLANFADNVDTLAFLLGLNLE